MEIRLLVAKMKQSAGRRDVFFFMRAFRASNAWNSLRADVMFSFLCVHCVQVTHERVCGLAAGVPPPSPGPPPSHIACQQLGMSSRNEHPAAGTVRAFTPATDRSETCSISCQLKETYLYADFTACYRLLRKKKTCSLSSQPQDTSISAYLTGYYADAVRRCSSSLLTPLLISLPSPLPNALPSLQPTFARRTSGHCLGTFIVENVSLPPR
jgi:hypothetical protein